MEPKRPAIKGLNPFTIKFTIEQDLAEDRMHTLQVTGGFLYCLKASREGSAMEYQEQYPITLTRVESKATNE